MMDAKCLCCGGQGEICDECGGTGRVTFNIASGTWYTVHCNTCTQNNGSKVLSDEFQWDPSEKPPINCVFCKSEDVVWRVQV